LGDSTQQTEPPLRLAKQDRATSVAGDVPTAEFGLYDPATNTWKGKLENGTIWHGEASFCSVVSKQNYKGIQASPFSVGATSGLGGEGDPTERLQSNFLPRKMLDEIYQHVGKRHVQDQMSRLSWGRVGPGKVVRLGRKR